MDPVRKLSSIRGGVAVAPAGGEGVAEQPARFHDTVKNHPILGVALVFAAAAGFSAKGVLVKIAYGFGVDPVTLLGLRMFFSLPFFVFMLIWFRGNRMGRVELLAAGGLGFLGYYVGSFLDLLGLQYVSAGLERMILFLYPTIVVLLSALIYRKPIVQRQMLALLLSYGGIYLAFMHDASFNDKNILLGGMLVLGNGLTFACYLLGGDVVISRIGAARFTAVAMIAACLASILQFLLLRPLHALSMPLKAYEAALAMAIFSTVLPAIFLSAGIRRIGPERAALVSAAGPVMTIILAYYLLGEPVSLLQIIGSILVLSGVLLISLQK
jgi:drug/metabolite transporter (DMT)-like permease